jgi:hypothetical protein
MKENIGLNSSYSEEEVKIARALSSAMSILKRGDCLDIEDISALAGGNLEEEEKDSLMDHVSSCDSCYKTYVLTSKMEAASAKDKAFFSRPLALAASFLITALSLFFVYRTFIETGASRDFYAKFSLNKNFQEFLNKTNKEKITDRKVIDNVLNIIKDHGQSIKSSQVERIEIKWPEKQTKSIFWIPKLVEISVKDGVLTIIILE